MAQISIEQAEAAATEAGVAIDEPDEITAQYGEIGDDEAQPEHGAVPSMSQSRKVRSLAFDNLFSKAIQETGVAELSRAAKQGGEEEILSMRNILEKSDPGRRIIGSPRDYQVELFERAKTANTIAVLDTGSGKTLIAVLLIKFILDQELERRAQGLPQKIAVFLVDKVTLVMQQHAVLSANLDHKVGHFYGNMGASLWSRAAWLGFMDTYSVIVCTADVILAALMHSFITIDQISLLIFDEAHHAKQGHPYAKIIRDFYTDIPAHVEKPRIFGMTASPVDVKTVEEVVVKAKELESLLHARICTASDMKLLQACVKRPKETIARFNRLDAPFETELYQSLKQRYSTITEFGGFFEHAKAATAELGRWCSDVYWKFAFSDRQAKKIQARTMVRHNRRMNKASTDMSKLERDLELLKHAQDLLSGHDFGIPRPIPEDVSPKVIKLWDYLVREFERSGESRVIIFVNMRHTAKLLVEVFQHIGTEFLRPGSLIGAASQTSDGMHNSFREQAVTLLKFRKGELNCLFATSVAEEGLDIQDCNVVIRFDPCRTMIQYIQSRGRARHTNSKMLHLIEVSKHSEEIDLLRICSAVKIMATFCSQLPEDRLLEDIDKDAGDVKNQSPRTYTEPTTKAKLTYDFALVVLEHFVTSVPHDPEEDMSVNCVISRTSGQYVCEVILPDKCPIRSVTGPPHSRKALAKRGAAFDACIQLRQDGFLDENLLPIYVKHLPAMRNARLGLNDKQPNSYQVLHKPTIWSIGRGEPTKDVYLAIISLASEWDRPAAPIGLVTRQPLPRLPPFPIYKIDGQACNVLIYSFKEPIQVTPERMGNLTGFTLRIWKDIFNKDFERNIEAMSWWLAPVLASFDEPEKTASEAIDWSMAAHVDSTEPYKWHKGMEDSKLAQKFMIDPWDGGRRLYTQHVEPTMNPLDPVPEGCAPAKHSKSILDYSISLWRKSRERNLQWDTTQPVIKADVLHHRLNVLADPQEQDLLAVTRAFVCPEPLFISPLPVEIAVMSTLFPAMIHRIESYLVAIEFFDRLQLEVAPALALEAVTKDSDNQEDHGVEKINFQRGMGPNYERLEFLGDCFLKMATSIALFVRFRKDNEFEMHVNRMTMICNQNLRDTALREKYYVYVRGEAFSRRTWYPQGLKLLQGKAVGKSAGDRQTLGGKTIADICEAAIGALLVTHFESGYKDPRCFDRAVQATKTFVDNPNFPMETWQDFVDAYEPPAYQTDPSTAANRDLAAKLQREHSYTFRYPRLAQSAFSHSSLPRGWNGGIPDYQRLEFLGDSLLDMTIITHLYYRFPDKDPQWLTEHKMAMVCNKFLGALCVKLGFYRHIRHNSPVMEGQIRDFVTEMEELESGSQGQRNYWMAAKEPPKCLADVVEAYAGAIFVDAGFSYAAVQAFFDAHVAWFFADMSIYDTFASNHPVSRLQTWLNESMGCFEWHIEVREAPMAGASETTAVAGLVVHATAVGEGVDDFGVAAAVKNAKARAASKALTKLAGLAPYEFRARFGCDCQANKASR